MVPVVPQVHHENSLRLLYPDPPGQAGEWTRCTSAEHSTEGVCPLLHAELEKTDNPNRGEDWWGQTRWRLRTRKVMPESLIAWTYHVQWLLLAHEIEPFSLLSFFAPQLGSQVVFSSVLKEESYCHLSKELIKTQHMAIQTGVINLGEALSFCGYIFTTSLKGHDMEHIWCDIYSRITVIRTPSQYKYHCRRSSVH